jgi:hypothetical protein
MCTNLAEETDRVARIQRVLGSLRFELIKQRQSNVKHAHAKTLEWIFSDCATNTRPRAPLLNWMKTQNGIFWIQGKAGSGKSTLMKFLCDHRTKKDSLQKWADGSKLCLASYFFWSAGTEMQKSQEGLLQTLLHQILQQCPEMTPSICPNHWKQSSLSFELEPWSLGALEP